MNRYTAYSAFLAVLFLASCCLAEVPAEIESLVSEMRETGATVRSGSSSELGVYFVGIGRSRYRSGAVSRSREVAQANAVKELTSALQVSFKAHDIASLQVVNEDDKTSVSAFVSSMTESSIDQLLKGVQVVSSGKNQNGEMEVVVYTTAKLVDKSDALLNAQLKWGDRGVVMAVGIDEVRTVAEKNALRSAVEQVAGTLVVGKVSVNEREEMHKRLATTATALVEEYRVVKETKAEAEFRVEVLAKVNKRKLYDNYRSFFKSLDNPAFYLDSTDDGLVRAFRPFFVEKGFTIVDSPENCQYLIRLDGRFTDRPTPGNPASTGTMLDLSIEVLSCDGHGTQLLSMAEKQSKDSEVLTAEQRRMEVSRRIFAKLEKRLHKAVQDMVVRMLDDADSQPAGELGTGTAF